MRRRRRVGNALTKIPKMRVGEGGGGRGDCALTEIPKMRVGEEEEEGGDSLTEISEYNNTVKFHLGIIAMGPIRQ